MKLSIEEPKPVEDGDSDDLLAVKARRGDKEAFGHIYDRYSGRVARLLRTYARDNADLEDMVHDTFSKAMDALSSYRSEGVFRSWLFTIALNVGRKEVRRRKKALSLQDPDSLLNTSDPGADLLLEAEDRKTLGETLLRSLDESKRLVVILRVWLEFSYDEIAMFLGIPSGTARRRMFTALNEMKRSLDSTHLNTREVVAHDINRSQSSGR